MINAQQSTNLDSQTPGIGRLSRKSMRPRDPDTDAVSLACDRGLPAHESGLAGTLVMSLFSICAVTDTLIEEEDLSKGH